MTSKKLAKNKFVELGRKFNPMQFLHFLAGLVAPPSIPPLLDHRQEPFCHENWSAWKSQLTRKGSICRWLAIAADRSHFNNFRCLLLLSLLLIISIITNFIVAVPFFVWPHMRDMLNLDPGLRREESKVDGDEANDHLADIVPNHFVQHQVDDRWHT